MATDSDNTLKRRSVETIEDEDTKKTKYINSIQTSETTPLTRNTEGIHNDSLSTGLNRESSHGDIVTHVVENSQELGNATFEYQRGVTNMIVEDISDAEDEQKGDILGRQTNVSDTKSTVSNQKVYISDIATTISDMRTNISEMGSMISAMATNVTVMQTKTSDTGTNISGNESDANMMISSSSVTEIEAKPVNGQSFQKSDEDATAAFKQDQYELHECVDTDENNHVSNNVSVNNNSINDCAMNEVVTAIENAPDETIDKSERSVSLTHEHIEVNIDYDLLKNKNDKEMSPAAGLVADSANNSGINDDGKIESFQVDGKKFVQDDEVNSIDKISDGITEQSYSPESLKQEVSKHADSENIDKCGENQAPAKATLGNTEKDSEVTSEEMGGKPDEISDSTQQFHNKSHDSSESKVVVELVEQRDESSAPCVEKQNSSASGVQDICVSSTSKCVVAALPSGGGDMSETEISGFLDDTFEVRRTFITMEEPRIVMVRQMFPVLFTANQLSMDFQRITNIDIDSVLREYAAKYGKGVLNLAKANPACSDILRRATSIKHDHPANTRYWNMVAFICVIPSLMKEKLCDMILEVDADTSLIETRGKIQPIIVSKGNIFQSYQFSLIIEEEVVQEYEEITLAFVALFASYWVFNMEYPATLANTYAFLQKSVIKMKEAVVLSLTVKQFINKVERARRRSSEQSTD